MARLRPLSTISIRETLGQLWLRQWMVLKCAWGFTPRPQMSTNSDLHMYSFMPGKALFLLLFTYSLKYTHLSIYHSHSLVALPRHTLPFIHSHHYFQTHSLTH